MLVIERIGEIDKGGGRDGKRPGLGKGLGGGMREGMGLGDIHVEGE